MYEKLTFFDKIFFSKTFHSKFVPKEDFVATQKKVLMQQ
jgi:hypothetical protein